MKKILIAVFIASLAVCISLVGCQKGERPETESPVQELSELEMVEEEVLETEAVSETELVEDEALQVVEEEDPNAFYEGIVTFLSGEAEVQHKAEPKWVFLDVDDSVLGNDKVKTGSESFCEVQFTEFGIIRIQQQTEVLIGSVFLKEEKNKVRLKLDRGNLLCKIDKLSKDEEFQVETGTVLAGVRGTEFLVREAADGTTLIAVNEGEVSVTPNEIAKKIEAIEADLQTETARELLQEVTASEILVTESKEVVIEPSQVEEAVRQFEAAAPEIEKKIRKIDEKAAKVEEKQQVIESKPEKQTAGNLREVEEMKEEIQVLKEEVVESSRGVTLKIDEMNNKIDAVSTTSKREFSDIEKMAVRDFIIAAKKAEKEEEPDASEPMYTKLTIEVDPPDARIYIDDKDYGRGKSSGLYESGAKFKVRVVRRGYKTATRTITVPRKKSESIYIKLESPVVWSYREEQEQFIRRAAVSQDRIVLANTAGMLVCIGGEGRRMWTVPTENRPNDNSMPILAQSRVLFSGASEFVAVDLVSGEVVKRMKLSKERYPAQLFGSPAVPFGNSILLPADDLLVFLDVDSLRQSRSIPVKESGLGSPTAYGDHLVVVDEHGDLLVIDPETGGVEFRLETAAFQMVGSSPSMIGERVVFGDNAGTVVLADLRSRKVLWEKQIGEGRSGAVFQDIVVGEKAVYPHTGEEFHALAIESGEELFGSVRSSCNPLYREGFLYFGDPDASLVMMDGVSGRVMKRYGLDSPVTVMPAFHGENLVVATRSGTVYMIEAEHM
jgi:hypothetical protein